MKDGSSNTDELPDAGFTETLPANTHVDVLPAVQEVPVTSSGYKRPPRWDYPVVTSTSRGIS